MIAFVPRPLLSSDICRAPRPGRVAPSWGPPASPDGRPSVDWPTKIAHRCLQLRCPRQAHCSQRAAGHRCSKRRRPLPHPSLPDLLPRSTRTHGEEIIQLSGHLRDLLPRTTKTSTVLHQGTIVASGPSRELQGNPKGVVRAVPEVLVWPHPTTP